MMYLLCKYDIFALVGENEQGKKLGEVVNDFAK